MTARIIFYVIGLLYILSTATLVYDFLVAILQRYPSVSKNSIFILKNIVMRIGTLSPQLQIEIRTTLYRLGFAQQAVVGCCDLIAQCILVRINHCAIIRFQVIHLNLQRSTDVGSCGVKISVL